MVFNTGRLVLQNTSSELVKDNKKCFHSPERKIMRFKCVNLPLQQHDEDSAVLEWRMHLATVQRLPLSSVQYNTTLQMLCLGCNLGIIDDTHLRYQSPELVMSNVKAAALSPDSVFLVDPVLSRANWSVLIQTASNTTVVSPPLVTSSANNLAPVFMTILVPIVLCMFGI